MPSRIPIPQTFSMNSLAVTNNPNPISSLDVNSLTMAFMISNPSTNVSSVFLGDSGVTTANGIEITPGSAPLFSLDDVRQLYEVQNSLIRVFELLKCDKYPDPDFIPLVVWNPSLFYLVAAVAGPTTVGMMFFKNVYI